MRSFDLRQWIGFSAAGGDPSRPALIDRVAVHSAQIEPATLFVALEGVRQDGHSFVPTAIASGARFCCVRKEFPVGPVDETKLLRVIDPLKALQEIAQCYRLTLKTRVVAITGSFGKTLTKDLLAALLRRQQQVGCSPESFNSQLGVCLSLLDVEPHHEIALIEAGISRRGEMGRLAAIIAPDHAILTSLGPAHLASLGSLEAIIEEKCQLLQSVSPHGWVLTPENLPLAIRESLRARLVQAQEKPWVAQQPNKPLHYSVVFPQGRQFSFRIARGFPQLHRVLELAIRAAYLLGTDPESIREGLQHYSPELMRTEVWTSPLGVTFVNDCYGADPLSLQHSLGFLASRGSRNLLLFGGLAATQPVLHRTISRAINGCSSLHQVALIGDSLANAVGEELSKPYSCHPDPATALRQLRTTLCPGQTVLIKGAARQGLDKLRHHFAEGIGETRLEVHMDALRHNVAALSHSHPDTAMIGMVKADGYGTGAHTVGRFLTRCGVTLLGVAHLCEAISLRLAGIEEPIFVFSAAPHEAAQIVQWNLEVGVSDLNQIEQLAREAAAHDHLVRVHLHLDTGMTRFGCREAQVRQLAHAIKSSSHLEPYGFFSHLSGATDPTQDATSTAQIALFTRLCRELEAEGYLFPLRHLANTAGACRFAIPPQNGMRIGIGLFGLQEGTGSQLKIPLQPALTLTSRLIAIHNCQPGDRVSYGGKYCVQAAGARIGVVPMGYFDGLRRTFGGNGAVLIRGKRAPLIGEICMDFCMVDLSGIPSAQVDDGVLFFGEDEMGFNQDAIDFARSGGLSVYELIAGLGPRVQRLYFYDGESRDFL
jgi:Alr-MurF fusion protein